MLDPVAAAIIPQVAQLSASAIFLVPAQLGLAASGVSKISGTSQTHSEQKCHGGYRSPGFPQSLRYPRRKVFMLRLTDAPEILTKYERLAAGFAAR